MQMKWILLSAVLIVAGVAVAFVALAPAVTPAGIAGDGEAAAGDAFMLANQSGIALSLYDSALAMDADNPSFLKKKGEALIRSGKTDEAGQIYRQLYARNANDTAVVIRMGDFRYWQGDYAGAIAYYDTALALQPDNAKTWLRQGDAYLLLAVGEYHEQHAVFLDSLDTYRKAMDDYAKAQKFDPRLSAVVSARTLAADQFQANGNEQGMIASLRASA